MPLESDEPEPRFVVEVRRPVPDAQVGEVSAAVAVRFGMDPERVRKLLEGRTGAVTKPVLGEKADLIARVFQEAGVVVSVRPAEEGGRAERIAPRAGGGRGLRAPGEEPEATPSTMFLSSTRWVPSPHETPDGTPEPADGPASVSEPAEADPTLALAVQHGSDPPPGAAAPSVRSTPLRTYLLVGFAASLLLLLALQAINGMEASRSRPASSVEAGMRAYNEGDFALARRLWTPLANVGNPRAQYMLGYMAQNGQGRPWSNRDAAAWYRLAADQGYPQAQLALGRLYQRGMGVDRDAATAASLFKAAAEEGYGPAQYRYALALFNGVGVRQDFASALRWFGAAARDGVAEARPYVQFARSGAAGVGLGSAADGRGSASGAGPTKRGGAGGSGRARAAGGVPASGNAP